MARKFIIVLKKLFLKLKYNVMKNQKTEKEISNEEQKEIDKINLQESGVDKSKSEEKEKSKENETPKTAKKVKHSGEVVAEGYTDGAGNFLPADKEGNISDAYKERIKDMKPYKRYSDGTVEVG